MSGIAWLLVVGCIVPLPKISDSLANSLLGFDISARDLDLLQADYLWPFPSLEISTEIWR